MKVSIFIYLKFRFHLKIEFLLGKTIISKIFSNNYFFLSIENKDILCYNVRKMWNKFNIYIEQCDNN